jgi:hypothetical protein
MATLAHGQCVRTEKRKNGKRTVERRRNTDARNWPRALGRKIVGQDSNLVIQYSEHITIFELCPGLFRGSSQQKK